MTYRQLSNEDLRIDLECLSESLATCQDATTAVTSAPDDRSVDWKRVVAALGKWGDRLEADREKVRTELDRRMRLGSEARR